LRHFEVFKVLEAVSVEFLRDLSGIEVTEPGFSAFGCTGADCD
jgi:hypothetical protein